nr:DUF943 family protein [Winslowiella toletana]
MHQKIDDEESYKNDLYCFNAMKTNRNCIRKNLLLTIRKGVDGKTKFTIGIDGDAYVLDNNKILKIQQNKNW